MSLWLTLHGRDAPAGTVFCCALPAYLCLPRVILVQCMGISLFAGMGGRADVLAGATWTLGCLALQETDVVSSWHGVLLIPSAIVFFFCDERCLPIC